jgi:hypothetical protein
MKVPHKFRLKWADPDPDDEGLYLIRTEDLEIPVSRLACLESSLLDLSRKYRAAYANFLDIESLEWPGLRRSR